MSKKRSIFIADQANDEDEEEDAVRGDDGEEEDEGEENVAGLIADKVERDKRGTHLAVMADLRQEREREEEAQLAAAEERYAALGAAYVRDTRETQYHEPGEFSELAVQARVEAAKAEAVRQKLAKAAAAKAAAEEAARMERQKQALDDLYDLLDTGAGSSSSAGAGSGGDAASSAAPPAPPRPALTSGVVEGGAPAAPKPKYRIGKKKARTE